MSEYTMYTKDGCTYCNAAKSLLQSKGLTFEELKIPNQVTKDQVQMKVTESGSNVVIRTVPQIFHGDKYIGGFNELQRYLR